MVWWEDSAVLHRVLIMLMMAPVIRQLMMLIQSTVMVDH